jgi:ubiquinone/menaquinone biosynthesis C-methylase UbiE
MDVIHQIDSEQAALWNGAAGRAWVETQDLLDQLFKPVEDLLVDAVRAACGRRVLDIGCGTGSTTRAIARLPGPAYCCTGVDISEPMITAARARAEQEGTPASFIVADAQTHAFEPTSFDMMISRFGVMFFNDSVAAFQNLRRAANSGALLQVVAWRSAAENPFMTTAERAAAPFLPNLPVRRANAQGQFAFADACRVRTMLEESGWTGISIRPVDVPCTLREDDLIRYLTRLGPVGLVLQQADDRTRTQVVTTVRSAFDPWVSGAEVRFTAACWMVSARAPATVRRAPGV